MALNEILLIKDDCLEAMSRIVDASIDLCLTDPPYGTTQCKWDSIIPLEPMWEQLRRIIKAKGAIVMTATQPFSSVLTNSNINMFKYQWVWIKTKITGVLNAKKMPVRKHEQILVFCKSSTLYNAQGLLEVNKITKQGGCSNNYGTRNTEDYKQKYTNWPRDVLEFKSVGKSLHPTQKPVALMEYLIKTYTKEGELVLDFTMGSGTTGVACVNLGRSFIGIENDDKYFEIAKNRIKDAIGDKDIALDTIE